MAVLSKLRLYDMLGRSLLGIGVKVLMTFNLKSRIGPWRIYSLANCLRMCLAKSSFAHPSDASMFLIVVDVRDL